MIPWGLVLRGAAVLAVVLSVYFAYKWFTGVLEENKQLTAMNLQLETKIADERASHEATKADYASWRKNVATQLEVEQASRDELEARYVETRKESNELSKKLGRHDLEHLASKKPGLVQSRVNRATDRVFRDIEKLTGDFSAGSSETPASP